MTRTLALVAALLLAPLAAADPIEINLIVHCQYVELEMMDEIRGILDVPPPPNACDDDPCDISDLPGCPPKAWEDLMEYRDYVVGIIGGDGDVTVHLLP